MREREGERATGYMTIYLFIHVQYVHDQNVGDSKCTPNSIGINNCRITHLKQEVDVFPNGKDSI